MEFLQTITLFAAQNGGGGNGGGQDGGGAASFGLFIPMILILILFFWMTNRSQKKKQQEREEMVDSIRARDDVVTIGGIHGRVVDVDAETFTLRIDPKNDIRITINKSAVARKAGEEEEEEAA